jgi:hypothetical protein
MPDVLAPLLGLKPSKTEIDQIYRQVLVQPELLPRLMELVQNPDPKLAAKAAWPMSYVFQDRPDWMEPYYDLMGAMLNRKDLHQGIIRNLLRALQEAGTRIPEEAAGNIMNACFDRLLNPAEAIAIKAFSITVLENLVVTYPDIREELISTLDFILPTASAGVRSRAQKTLKRLRK